MTAQQIPTTVECQILGKVTFSDDTTLGMIEQVDEYLRGVGYITKGPRFTGFRVEIEAEDDFELGREAQLRYDEVKMELEASSVDFRMEFQR